MTIQELVRSKLPVEKSEYMIARQILVNARKLIEAGWIKGADVQWNQDHTNSYCLDGAISESAHSARVRAEKAAPAAAAAARMALINVIDGSIVNYNDAPERTKEEVLRTIDKAIERIDDDLDQASTTTPGDTNNDNDNE